MPPPVEERRPAITPQLAVRVALLGGFAFVLFAIVFFRLWFLQVLTGEDYVSQARENRVRKVRIEAPRGDIVDRNGQRARQDPIAPVVQITPESLRRRGARRGRRLPQGARRRPRRRGSRRATSSSRSSATCRAGGRTQGAERRERRRLRRAARPRRRSPSRRCPPRGERARLLPAPRPRDRCQPAGDPRRVIEGDRRGPYSNVTIKTDVTKDAFDYLLERHEDFPGVVGGEALPARVPTRSSAPSCSAPARDLARRSSRRGATRASRPARGSARRPRGALRQVPARQGRLHAASSSTRSATATTAAGRRARARQGDQLRLTLDLGLQRAANNAMASAISRGRAATAPRPARSWPWTRRNGEVLALGSYPSFDANVFAKPMSQRKYDELNSEANGAPLFNRAIAATYPTGSTFKPITAMAAMESGIITPSAIDRRHRQFKLGTRCARTPRGASSARST